MLETLLRRLHMVRLTIGTVVVALAMGCAGLIDSGGDDAPGAQLETAKQLWVDKALPVLRTNCQVCHDGKISSAPGFMKGASDLERRDTLMTFAPAAVNLEAVQTSRVLTKGVHEGPALDAAGTAAVLEWLTSEQTVVSSDEVFIQSAPIDLQICATTPCPLNTIALDDVGEGQGAAGASISFAVQQIGTSLYFTNITVNPGSGGVFIEHPLFVTQGEGTIEERPDCQFNGAGRVTCPDAIDRFFAVKLNVPSGASTPDTFIGGGTAAFTNFRATDQFAIHFKAVKAFQDDSSSADLGGCKELAAFKAVRGAFSARVGAGASNQTCFQCHGGANSTATTAMNLSQLNSTDDAELVTACNEIRSRLNFQDFAQSPIVLAPDPNSAHPARFSAGDATTFRNMIKPWFDAEQVSGN